MSEKHKMSSAMRKTEKLAEYELEESGYLEVKGVQHASAHEFLDDLETPEYEVIKLRQQRKEQLELEFAPTQDEPESSMALAFQEAEESLER